MNRNSNFDASTDILNAFADQYPGVDPLGIYCQFTGKRIGETDIYEFHDLCESLAGDLEDRVDDIAMRLFASMRPSMRWNKLRMESLDQLRKSAPLETLSYCLNRLFTPAHYRGSMLALNHDRIRLFNQLTLWNQLEEGRAFIKNCLFAMIEVDAKIALITQSPRLTAVDFLDNFTSFETLWDKIDNWHMSQIDEAELIQSRRDMETRWFRDGNTLAKAAAVSQFFESRPPSKRKVINAAKQEDKSFMRGILGELLSDSETPKPVVDALNEMPAVESTHKPLVKPTGLAFLKSLKA